MEELSIKEKAKRYDEAIKRAESIYNETTIPSTTTKGICTYIFPELKESEDERVRNKLIEFFKGYSPDEEWWGNITQEDILSWLEKHGEQKSIDEIAKEVCKNKESAVTFLKSTGIMNEKGELADEYKIEQDEQKPTNEVEPKFKIGDWVIDKQGIVHQIANVIENVTYHTYGYDIVGGGYFNDNTEGVRLWTIQDAKDGDALVASDGSIFLFKGTIDCACKHYVAITTDNVVKFNEGLEHYWETSTAVHPATKEQRDQLEKAMADAGYTFDFEKKELKKIAQNPVIEMKTPEESLGVDSDTYNKIVDECVYGEQKSAWSEEDEEIYRKCICAMRASACGFPEEEKFVEQVDNWFKYIKDRVQPQNSSVTDEELAQAKKNAYNDALDKIEYHSDEPTFDDGWSAAIDYIRKKFLKDRVQPQPKQEWSQNDIDMIDWLIRCCEKEHEELCNDKYGHQDIVSDLKRDCRKKWNWLESLKNKVVPQSHWKPSDEQMDALHYVTNFDYGGHKATLVSLYEQLMKLKG